MKNYGICGFIVNGKVALPRPRTIYRCIAIHSLTIFGKLIKCDPRHHSVIEVRKTLNKFFNRYIRTNIPEVLNVHVNENFKKSTFFRIFFFKLWKINFWEKNVIFWNEVPYTCRGPIPQKVKRYHASVTLPCCLARSYAVCMLG